MPSTLLAHCAEVLDGNLRPLCIMPLEAVRAQQLPHRAVALFAHDGAGNLLLAADDSIGPTAFAMVQARQARQECAENLLAVSLGLDAPLRELSVLPACQGANGAWLSVYGARFPAAALAALESGNMAIAAAASLPALGEHCGPLLRAVMASGALRAIVPPAAPP